MSTRLNNFGQWTMLLSALYLYLFHAGFVYEIQKPSKLSHQSPIQYGFFSPGIQSALNLQQPPNISETLADLSSSISNGMNGILASKFETRDSEKQIHPSFRSISAKLDRGCGPLPGCNRGKWRLSSGSHTKNENYSLWSLSLWSDSLQQALRNVRNLEQRLLLLGGGPPNIFLRKSMHFSFHSWSHTAQQSFAEKRKAPPLALLSSVSASGFPPGP